MSRICLCLTGKTLEEDIAIYKKYAGSVDLFELRSDFLQNCDTSSIHNFISQSSIPLILTCRRPDDGGAWQGSESERLLFLSRLVSAKPEWIDLEEDVPEKWEQENLPSRTKVIRSFHDFDEVPEKLAEKMLFRKKKEGDCLKAAVSPVTAIDNLRIVEAAGKLSKSGNPFILLGMGASGFWTRVLSERLGSYLTFTSPAGTSAAPGHCTPELLTGLYRFKTSGGINSDVYGITGNPLGHTRSPEIHNGWLNRDSYPGVYIPFPVSSIETQLFEWADQIGIKGFSVTVPFKEKVIPFLDEVSDSVKQIGACNTVYKRGSRWIGENSDWTGFLNPLKEQYGHKLKGKKVCLIGAGGAARAAVYALKKEACEILIVNRTESRGKVLADEFDVQFASLGPESAELIASYSDIIVQTGSAGMAGKFEKIDPLAFYPFSGREFVYDIIYNPEKTLLLKRAEEAGCFILNGYPMLEAQAVVQYNLFTRKKDF